MLSSGVSLCPWPQRQAWADRCLAAHRVAADHQPDTRAMRQKKASRSSVSPFGDSPRQGVAAAPTSARLPSLPIVLGRRRRSVAEETESGLFELLLSASLKTSGKPGSGLDTLRGGSLGQSRTSAVEGLRSGSFVCLVGECCSERRLPKSSRAITVLRRRSAGQYHYASSKVMVAGQLTETRRVQLSS